jgi:hypothetical protein
MAQESFAKQRLIYSILKFLDKEIQSETANAERRESIEGKLDIHLNHVHIYSSLVAIQCLETSFNVSLANPHNDLVRSAPLDLLSLVSNKSVIYKIS